MKEHERASNDKPEPKPARDEVAKKAYALYEKRASARTRPAELVGG
jgi:hypothetical protein